MAVCGLSDAVSAAGDSFGPDAAQNARSFVSDTPWESRLDGCDRLVRKDGLEKAYRQLEKTYTEHVRGKSLEQLSRAGTEEVYALAGALQVHNVVAQVMMVEDLDEIMRTHDDCAARIVSPDSVRKEIDRTLGLKEAQLRDLNQKFHEIWYDLQTRVRP